MSTTSPTHASYLLNKFATFLHIYTASSVSDIRSSSVENTVVKVDRRIRWHYTTTIIRLRICARLTRYRNCKLHNGCRTISRLADGISRYSVPPSAGPLLLLRKYELNSPSLNLRRYWPPSTTSFHGVLAFLHRQHRRSRGVVTLYVAQRKSLFHQNEYIR